MQEASLWQMPHLPLLYKSHHKPWYSEHQMKQIAFDSLDLVLVRTCIFPSDNTGEVEGSSATIFHIRVLLFQIFACSISVRVPPVPTPAMKISTFPLSVPPDLRTCSSLVHCQVRRIHKNCPGMKLFGISSASSYSVPVALAMAPFIPLVPSVTKNKLCAVCFQNVSTLNTHGLWHGGMILYPLAAAIDARPIPVFPEVGSMITEPSFRIPFCSASSIIALAILCLNASCRVKVFQLHKNSSFQSKLLLNISNLYKWGVSD